MAVDLLLGLQWGDEGKGKIVDVLTKNYDIIARFQGGPNAGHTLIFDGHKHVLHTIPSGIFHKTALNVVGNGVVIDPVIFKKELENLDKHDIDYESKLLISRKAHLILPTHRLLDAASETSKGKAKIGSTLKGIGPTYMDKTGRNGMRVGDLELENWKDKYQALTTKHIKMLDFFNVDIQYDLKELEEEFSKGVDKLRRLQFIDSEEFLNNADKSGLPIKKINNSAINSLMNYSWPGNVRELENFILRTCALYSEDILSEEIIDLELKQTKTDNDNAEKEDLSNIIDSYFSNNFNKLLKVNNKNIHSDIISEVERSIIQNVLIITKGNQLKASEMLGLNRNTLRKKIGDLNINIQFNKDN